MKMARTAFLCMVATFVPDFAAHASVITNNVVIDLGHATITDDSSGGQSISGFITTLVPVPAFTLNLGDTLVTTVSFADGARLKILNGPSDVYKFGPDYLESLAFYFEGEPYIFSGSNTTNVVFSDLQGSLTDSTPGGLLYGRVSQSLYNNFTDSYISFTGLTMTTEITYRDGYGITSYDQFGLYFGYAGGFEVIGAATTVPEPASIIVWSVGLVILGLRSRLRHKSSSVARK